jgi:hypothetical protein
MRDNADSVDVSVDASFVADVVDGLAAIHC